MTIQGPGVFLPVQAIPDPQELKSVYDALKRNMKVVVNVTMEQLAPLM